MWYRSNGRVVFYCYFSNSGNLTIEENYSSRAGLMSDPTIHCSACDESIPWQTSPKITKKGKSFDVNRRAVYHSIESGMNYEGLSSFYAMMNMPGGTFTGHILRLTHM